MIIMRQTLTAPTIRSSLRLIWQFLPAYQGFQLQSSHSVLAPEQSLPGSWVAGVMSR